VLLLKLHQASEPLSGLIRIEIEPAALELRDDIILTSYVLLAERHMSLYLSQLVCDHLAIIHDTLLNGCSNIKDLAARTFLNLVAFLSRFGGVVAPASRAGRSKRFRKPRLEAALHGTWPLTYRTCELMNRGALAKSTSGDNRHGILGPFTSSEAFATLVLLYLGQLALVQLAL
jgi:hypothetical protein